MPIVLDDVHDMVDLIAAHPGLRAALRDLILDDNFTKVPGNVERLIERLSRLEVRFEDFDKRFESFRGEVLTRFDAADERFESFRGEVRNRFDAADERFESFRSEASARFDTVDRRLDKLDGNVGNFRGTGLEARYRDRARTWFGEWLRKIEVVALDDLDLVDDGLRSGRLSKAQVSDLRLADLLVRGTSQSDAPLPPGQVILVLEASSVIDETDVDRAIRRASVLKRAGYEAVPFCGGYGITAGAAEAAAAHGVLVDIKQER